MTEGKIINGRPQLAIIDSNTLAVLGLKQILQNVICLLYTSPSPRDRTRSRMPSSA